MLRCSASTGGVLRLLGSSCVVKRFGGCDSEDVLPFDGRASGSGRSRDGAFVHRPVLAPVSALAYVPSPSGLRGTMLCGVISDLFFFFALLWDDTSLHAVW